MHNTQVQDFAAAIAKGATVIAVDPRFSTAAGKAKYWLPIKPGTDMALLLAWMHVIVNEGLYDREYVEAYATGFEELKKHVADKTPEWAFTETTIRPEIIVETARVIAGARPASLIHPGRHTTWYGDDTQRSRAVAILNALVGSWGRRGGIFVPASMKVPAYPVPAYAAKPKTTQDHPKGSRIRSPTRCCRTVSATRRSPAGSALPETPIKAWIVYGTNLLQALPRRESVLEAIQKLDLLVAVDVLPAEIVGYADVVLPECTYLERWDDVAPVPWREPFLAIRQPVVPPLYDSKPGWWIAKQLANRMDLGAYFPWDDAGAMVEARLAAGGYDVAAIKAKGVLRGKSVPVTTEDGLALSFATPSKKIELYSKQMEAAGLPPLPPYTRHEQPAPGQFRLLFGRTPVHTFGRTTNNRFLSTVTKDNEVWLNAKIARERGLADGESVVLVNQDGVRSAPARLKATERIRPDCVFVVHGYGHTSPGLKFARGRGLDDATLVTRVAVDPVAGSTGMSVNFVTVERAAAPGRGPDMSVAKKRYAMTVDTRACVGCKACVLACKAENDVPDGFCRDWIVEDVRGEFPLLAAEIRSERCNHCSAAPCVKNCPTGASHVNEGGRRPRRRTASARAARRASRPALTTRASSTRRATSTSARSASTACRRDSSPRA